MSMMNSKIDETTSFNDYEDDELKVWLYYHEDSLYAFTATKKFAKLFEKQRDMKAFRKIKKAMTNMGFSILSSRYSKHFMHVDYLWNGDIDYEIITTPDECNLLDAAIDHISTKMNQIYFDPSLIEDLPDCLAYNMMFLANEALPEYSTEFDIGSPSNHLRINTFDLFIDLHRDTFMKGEINETG